MLLQLAKMLRSWSTSLLRSVLLLVLLYPQSLNCSSRWQLPPNATAHPALSKIAGTAAQQRRTSQSSAALERRASQIPALSTAQQRRTLKKHLHKTSREALKYGLQWKGWCLTHNKSYQSSGETLERYVIWRANIAYIQSHNAYAESFGFTLAMNSFGDLTSEEFSRSMYCEESPYFSDHAHPEATPLSSTGRRSLSMAYFNSTRAHRNMVLSGQSLPEEVDWRASGAVTQVKDQGRCKSCYAFATVAALEGMHALSTGQLVSLSEQNIIDCSVPYGNRGCSGGSRLSAVMYMVDTGGVDISSAYPYIARQYLCKFSEESIGSKCTGVVRITAGDEEELEQAVAVAGPVSVAVDSRHTSFQFYSSGVYSEPSCSRSKLTHSLLVIGYGTTSKGKDYWILKNSWGTTWGKDGYIMMTRNYANQCGVASKAMYITM